MISVWGVDHGGEVVSKLREMKSPEQRHSLNRPSYFNSRKQNAVGGAIGGAAIGGAVGATSLRGAGAGAAIGSVVGAGVGGGLAMHRGSDGADQARRANIEGTANYNRYAQRHNALKVKRKAERKELGRSTARANFKGAKKSNMSQYNRDTNRTAARYYRRMDDRLTY